MGRIDLQHHQSAACKLVQRQHGVGRDRAMAALHALMLAGQMPSATEVKEDIDLLARLAS